MLTNSNRIMKSNCFKNHIWYFSKSWILVPESYWGEWFQLLFNAQLNDQKMKGLLSSRTLDQCFMIFISIWLEFRQNNLFIVFFKSRSFKIDIASYKRFGFKTFSGKMALTLRQVDRVSNIAIGYLMVFGVLASLVFIQMFAKMSLEFGTRKSDC